MSYHKIPPAVFLSPLSRPEIGMSGSAYVTERNVKSSTVGQLHVCQGLRVSACVAVYTTVHCTYFS